MPVPVTLRSLAALAALLLAGVPARAQAARSAFAHAVSYDVVAAGDDLRDLPLVEVPARSPGGHTLAILLTGDGDWSALMKGVSAQLVAHGVPVVGLKSRAYLEHAARTPNATARDVERVLREYMRRWGRDSVYVIGYSRGADMAPFIVSRLPGDLRGRVALVSLLGLAQSASFEFHWTDLVSDVKRPTDLPTVPELTKIRGMHIMCVFGADEHDSPCATADPKLMRSYGRDGGHHFDKNYGALGELILTDAALVH